MAQVQKTLSELLDLLQSAGFERSIGSPAIEAQRVTEHRYGVPKATILDEHRDYVLERQNGQVIAASVIYMNGRQMILAVHMVGDMRNGHYPQPYELTTQRLNHLLANTVSTAAKVERTGYKPQHLH